MVRSLDALGSGDRGEVDRRRVAAMALAVRSPAIGLIVGAVQLKRDFVADVPGLADEDDPATKMTAVFLALEESEAGGC